MSCDRGDCRTKSSIAVYINQLARLGGGVKWVAPVAGRQVKDQLEGVLERAAVVVGVEHSMRGTVYGSKEVSAMLKECSGVIAFLPFAQRFMPVLLAGMLRGIPVVMYVGNDYERELSTGRRGRLRAGLYRLSHELLLSNGAGVIGRGRRLTQELQKRNSSVIETVPICHRIEMCPDVRDQTEILREPRILYIGKLKYEKGIDVLVRAFKKLKVAGGCLRIIGEGTERANLESIAAGCEGKQIVLEGWRDGRAAIQKALCWSDVVVVPTRGYADGVPRVIEEAALAGRPVLASAVSGIVDEEYIDDTMLFRPDSVGSLTRALRRLLGDQGLYSQCVAIMRGRGDQLRYNLSAARQHWRFLEWVRAEERPQL